MKEGSYKAKQFEGRLSKRLKLYHRTREQLLPTTLQAPLHQSDKSKTAKARLKLLGVMHELDLDSNHASSFYSTPLWGLQLPSVWYIPRDQFFHCLLSSYT